MKRTILASLIAATLAAAAFGQDQPPAPAADNPRGLNSHELLDQDQEKLQKLIDEAKIRLEQMELNMPKPNGVGVIQPLQFQVGEVRKEKAAYLGTSTSPTNATTREQLKLARGTGLTVDFVDKDSPAATAGLQQHDVLTKLDDQLLVNMQQLAVLVRMHKPGDSVKLTYLRAGETKTADIKLAEKEMRVLDDNMMIQPFQIPVPPPNLRGDILLPREGADGGPAWQPAGRVTVKTENGVTTKTMTDADHTLTLSTDKDGKKSLGVVSLKENAVVFSGSIDTEEARKKLPADVAEKLKRLESDRVGGIRLNLGGNGAAGVNVNDVVVGGVTGSSKFMSRTDNQHSINVTVRNGDKHLTARDKQGNTLYDGPINTDEERKKVPEDVLKKLDGMEGKTGK